MYIAYKQSICDICGCDYSPASGNQRYCPDCQKRAKQLLAQESTVRVKNRKARAEREKTSLTWSEIIKICNDNNISYGKAMAKGLLKKTDKSMEQEG